MGDNGGIYSLAGFAYQIKVFVLNVLELKNGYTLEYETIDDVALKMAADKLDEHEDDLCSIFTTTSRRAIQVKKTQVTNSIAKKVVKNWILADKNNADIEQFVLVTDRKVDMMCYLLCEKYLQKNKFSFFGFKDEYLHSKFIERLVDDGIIVPIKDSLISILEETESIGLLKKLCG